MKELSISQSYFICSLNKKGRLKKDSSTPVCLLASGLMDLLVSHSVAVNQDKKLYVISELSEENQCLASLYSFIQKSKPMTVKALVSQYFFTFSDKRFNTLFNDIGASLVDLGYAKTERGGIFSKTPSFFPDISIPNRIIENIRQELLADGKLSDNLAILTSLMKKSNQLKKHFSKDEKSRLKERLKEIKKSDSSKLINEMIAYIDLIFVVIISSN